MLTSGPRRRRVLVRGADGAQDGKAVFAEFGSNVAAHAVPAERMAAGIEARDVVLGLLVEADPAVEGGGRVRLEGCALSPQELVFLLVLVLHLQGIGQSVVFHGCVNVPSFPFA
jgi:hypothetical protein